MPDTNGSLNSDTTTTKGSWWIFLAGLVIFIIFQTGLVLEVQLVRVLPPESDDAYLYIYNAVQLRQGFNYNTPALKDFRSQTKPEPGDSVDRQNLKWRLYHYVFWTQYILHSASLVLISLASGVSLEIAYKISGVLGSLLIAGAISYFLLTITDRISAGLALGTMAITMFPGQGIHMVVPSNICMAVGLFLVAIVLRNGGKSKWTLFGLSIIVLFLHRTGLIYASLGVFISAILRFRRENNKQIILDLLPTLILICVVIIIMYIFPLSIFRLSSMGAPPLDTTYYKEVWYNLIELFKLFGQWFHYQGVVTGFQPLEKFIANYWISFLGFQILGLVLFIAPWLMEESHKKIYSYLRWIITIIGAIILLPSFSVLMIILILRAGWLYPPQGKKFYFYLTFILFLSLLFPSIFHVIYITELGHPIHRAHLTNRLWVPFAVVLAALFARGLWVIYQQIRSGSYDFIPKNIQHNEFLKKGMHSQYLWAVLILFLLVGYTPHLVQAYNNREMVKYFMKIRQNVIFNEDQVNLAIEKTSPQDFIIYDDTLIRHYILCQGGLWRRAIYLPLQPLPENFDIDPKSKIYKIGWNPFLSVHFYENVRAFTYPLTIPAEAIYTLTFDSDFQPTELHLLPGSSKKVDGYFKLRIIRESATGVIKQDEIYLDGNTWQTYPLLPEKGGSLSLVNLDSFKPCFLAGLKFEGGQDSSFLWPWHGIREVKMDDKKRWIKRSVVISRERKIKGISFDLEVIQDRGSTVLWRLWPQDGKKP
jgi:hypothetical protein